MLDPSTTAFCESPLPDGLIHIVKVQNTDGQRIAKFLIARGGKIVHQGLLAAAGEAGDQYTVGVEGGANLKVANLSDDAANIRVSLESFAV